LFGIYAVNALIQRYSEGPISWWVYPVLIAGGALSFIPLNILANIAGALLVTATVLLTGRRAKAV